MAHKYTKGQFEFIARNVNGRNNKELTEIFNRRFGLNLKVSQIKAFKGNHSLNSGLDGRFKPGHIPSNKGLKGVCGKGCEKTWFKKGNVPINHKDVGSERIDKDGYTLIKVKEPNEWRLKHQVLWEKYNGLVPKGCAVIFGDGNKQNFELNNLILVSRQQLLILNKNKLIQSDADLTRTGVIIADICRKISERKSKRQK